MNKSKPQAMFVGTLARGMLGCAGTVLVATFMQSTVAQDRALVPSMVAEASPLISSPDHVVATMLEMAGVRATDFLVDLGSGDGRIVIAAAKMFGARGFGVDVNGQLVAMATKSARQAGVDDRIKFIQQDLFKTELGSATVISMYLDQAHNIALRPRLFALKPGTRIVSHDWHLGEWEADAKVNIPVPDKPVGRDKASRIYLWVVPAKLGGIWRTRIPSEGGWIDAELRFDQQFQKIVGAAVIGTQTLPIERASLSGEFVSFRIQLGVQTILFTGQVQNGRIVGQITLSGGRPSRWRALRSQN